MTTNNTATKERPILFSAEMVRAILDGRKTQTRRIVTVPWYKGKRCLPYEPYYVESDGKLLHMDEYGDYNSMEKYSPYGQPGDRLYVKETWAIRDCGNRVSLVKEAWPDGWPIDRLQYVATDDAPAKTSHGIDYWWNKRPSIFMPRWASRIDLAITNVRVERVRDITFADMLAEGVIAPEEMFIHDPARDEILALWGNVWNPINKKRGFGLDINPWVWVIEFERFKP